MENMTLQEFLKELEKQSDGNLPYGYEIKVKEYIFDSIDYQDLDSDEIGIDHEEKTIYIN